MEVLALIACAVMISVTLFVAAKLKSTQGASAAEYAVVLAIVGAAIAVGSMWLASFIGEKIEDQRQAKIQEFISEVFLLARDDPIRRVHGSFGMVILSNRGDASSQIVCSVMQSYYSRGKYSSRRKVDGVVQGVKPVYWPIIRKDPNYNTGCTYLLAYYDLSRATAMKRRLGLEGKGPFLIVGRFGKSREDEVASLLVYDLELVPNDEIAETFQRYLADYRTGKVVSEPIRAGRRQQIKTVVLRISEPISRLFGIASAAK